MKWETDDNGLPIDYIGDAEQVPVAEAMRELWRKYVVDAGPKNAELPWDYLGVYIYMDSGRVILYPVVKASRHRIERAMCQITCHDLLDSFDEMADTMSDDDFDNWHTQAVNKVVSLVSQAAKEANLPKSLGRSEIKIIYYSYSGGSGPVKEDLIKS